MPFASHNIEPQSHEDTSVFEQGQIHFYGDNTQELDSGSSDLQMLTLT